MKKILLSLAVLLLSSQFLFSQETEEKNWTHGGFVSFNAAQSHFSNWTSGGQDNINGLGTFKYSINYKKNKSKWDNNIDLALGYTYFDVEKKPMKTDDRIYLNSLYGYDIIKERLYLTSNLEFQTQFADGYDYKKDSTNKISKFMAPAYITLGIGAQWTPVSFFSLNLSPVSGRLTIVNDQKLADAGNFGLEPAKIDTLTGAVIEHSKRARMEVGAQLTADFKYEIFKNVFFSSKLIIFYDYLHARKVNALGDKYICRFDFDWDNSLVLKVNDWLNCNISAHLVYNEDIKPISGDSFLQFKEVLSIGLSYNIP